MNLLRRLILLAAVLAVAPAHAQEFGWRQYADPVFGMRIDYPATLFTGTETTPTGIVFTGTDVRLEVSAIAMPGIVTANDIRAYIGTAFGYDNVTYSPQGQSWLVLSGYRGQNVFYEKFFAVGGTIQGFSFEYPVAARHLYDPLVERLEDSFRPG